MSAESNDQRTPSGASRRARPARLAVLLACLAGLVAYVLLHSGSGSPAEGDGGARACAGAGAPRVLEVAPGDLGRLRASVARVLPGRVGRLYEEGTISSASPWTDEQPSGPTVSPTAKRQAGYEMRWWAPNGDDLVADVLLFSSPEEAARFLGRAAGPRCGHTALASAANRPPQARNLAWLNPDDSAEADVFLARGARVYRVADAPAGQQPGTMSTAQLRRTIYTIDTLACLLPGAHCSSVSRSVPA